MSLDFIEIAQAWINAVKPSETQAKLAKERYAFCLGCEHYRKSRPVTHDEYCAHCLCPLSKKIFSPKWGSCELGNWNKIDDTYVSILKTENKPVENTKNTKTIL